MIPMTISGFPAHPHRGFEAVTYMLEGHILHEDHLGHQGYIKTGGVQWMAAGCGIIHSEMPQQVSGAIRRFQLWINLPAKEKMKEAGDQDVQVEEIPTATLNEGSFEGDKQSTAGPIGGIATAPLFLDIHLLPNQEFSHPVAADHNALLYAYEGDVTVSNPLQFAPK